MIRIIDLRKSPPAPPAAAVSSPRAPSLHAEHALDPHAVAFITAVKDEAQYRICQQYLEGLQIPPGYDVETLAVLGGSSMPECYQAAMVASRARYKIYLHVDTYVVHQGLLSELLHLFQTYPRLGLVGVVGSTRLPPSGIFWVKNFAYCYGRLWQNSAPGFPASLQTLSGRRRLQLMRFRSFVGDYLPAAVVDGFFVATQYDIPWTRPEFGFEGPWDHVHTLEFIKAGFEVGIARQEALWCVHHGPLEASSHEQRKKREARLWPQAAALRNLYPAFVGVPVQRFYPEYRHVRTNRGNSAAHGPARDRLGIVIVSVNGREALLHALRAMLPQCEALKEVDYQVAVIGDVPTDRSVEVLRREFPGVNMIAYPSDGGPACAYNAGLRHLGFPSYILVTQDSAEVPAGTLAQMLGYLRAHPSTAGVVAPRIDPGGPVESPRQAVMDLIRRPTQRPQPITLIGTTCALVRGSVFFDLGLYDERFRAHHEAFDWSLRARRKGYRFALLPEATVVSRGGISSRRHLAASTADRLVDTLWLVYKHGGRRWATVLYGGQRLLAKWLEFRWGGDPEALRWLHDATAHMQGIYRMFRAENHVPLQLLPRNANRDLASHRE